MTNLLFIVVMAAITFSVRYAFFSDVIKIQLSDRANTFLSYTGPCVLSAMVAPIVFHPVDTPVYFSPYLLGGIATLIFSLTIRNTLTVVMSGMGVFLAIKYLV